jgi:ATP-binding cassette subfamily B (MDR/TAP) protein 1
MTGFNAKSRAAQQKAGQVASESITHIRTVASFTGEQALLDKFSGTLSKNRASGISSAHIAGIGYGFSQFVMFGAYALSFWYGMILVKQGEMSFASVMKVFMAILMAAFAIGQSGQLAPDYQKATKAANAIFALIDEESTIDPLSKEGQIAVLPHGDINMKNVHFEYPSRPGN